MKMPGKCERLEVHWNGIQLHREFDRQYDQRIEIGLNLLKNHKIWIEVKGFMKAVRRKLRKPWRPLSL